MRYSSSLISKEDVSFHNHKNATPNNMANLNDYIIDKNYEMVIERVRMNPDEAKSTNANGITPLHWLAFDNAPLESIEAVYKSYPDALHSLNKNGNTPFDVAIQCSSPDVVDFLRNPSLYSLNMSGVANIEITPLRDLRDLSNIELAHEIQNLLNTREQLFSIKTVVCQKNLELEYLCNEQQEHIFRMQETQQASYYENDNYKPLELKNSTDRERDVLLFRQINAGY
mmetsp:Transcript_48543/g.58575  ORF Transcript_48543/g.58575 Transcript_48543/m.58575 type:complete len:227 (+) Transcript_48543:71-751(+)